MISDRSWLVGRFNVIVIGNPMPRDTGPDGMLLILAGVTMIALTVAVVVVLSWSGWGFVAPISQANVNRTTR